MSEKKIMVLGAGRGQVGLINAAHELGYWVVVASIPGDYPGFSLADEIVYADLKDPEAVAEAAKEHQVDGVVAAGADLALPALGMACEMNGLPGLNVRSSLLSSDKSRMKDAFEKNGVNTARHITAYNEADAARALESLNMPLIVKPVDLGGSRGINIVFDKNEMVAAYQNTMSATSADYCVIEEYLEGYEVSATAFVAGGKTVFVLPMGDVRYGDNDEIPIGHYVPLDCEESVLESIEEQVRKAIKALEIDNCAVNADLMICGGEAYVLELTGRLGANAIPEITSHYYGEDIHKFIVETALGNFEYAQSYDFDKHSDKIWYACMLFSEKDGILESTEIEDKDCEALFFKKEGQTVDAFRSPHDCLGQVVVSGESLEACRKHADEIRKSIKVK